MKKKVQIDDYKPSTHNVLLSLSSSPKWVSKLVGSGKEYDAFAQALLHQNFFMDREERITIKGIAAHFDLKTTVVTKWLEKMYEDIFILNEEQPELFKSDGLKHTLYFKYTHGNSAWLTLWLMATPKIYETFHCYFVKAKVGFERFWVREVTHNYIDGEQEIDVFLEGGFANRYREWLFDRAKFENTIAFMDTIHLKDYEIDEILLNSYRR
jgi:hypothetical protein